MIHYSHCPICGSNEIKEVLKVPDFSVTHEVFEIFECKVCTGRFTQGAPDSNEIGRYYQSQAYISHSDTRIGFVSKLYHFARNYTLRSKRNLMEKLMRGGKGSLLDIGAGTGAFVNMMKLSEWKVQGIEPDAGARNRAKERYGLSFLPRIDDTQNVDLVYNAITMWHVLEHVHDFQKYLEIIRGILAPGGYLVIACPNYQSFDAKHFDTHWAAYDVPRHLYHFSEEAMGQVLDQHGFRLLSIKRMWLDSYYVSLLSEKYLSRSMGFVRALLIGTISNLKAVGNYHHCSSLIYIAQAR